MTTTKTITKLEEKLNGEYAESLKRHKLMVTKHKEGKELIQHLPQGFADMRWYSFQKLEDNKWYLETWGMPEVEADEFIKEIKLLGIHGLKSTYRSFNNSWEYRGSFGINGVELVIKVDGGSKPQNCRIEEHKELKEVITYKAICEETGEEVS